MPGLEHWNVSWICLAANTPPGGTQAEVLAKLLFYLLLLVVLFLFGSYAILRASRRFRERLVARRAKPTENSDVWAMHKLPEDAELPETPPLEPDEPDDL